MTNKLNFGIAEERHYRFARTQALYTPPLEKSPKLRAWVFDAIAGIFIVVFILTCIFW